MSVALSSASDAPLAAGLRGRVNAVSGIVAQLKAKGPVELAEFLDTVAGISISCICCADEASTDDAGSQQSAGITQLIDDRWTRLCSAAIIGGYEPGHGPT